MYVLQGVESMPFLIFGVASFSSPFMPTSCALIFSLSNGTLLIVAILFVALTLLLSCTSGPVDEDSERVFFSQLSAKSFFVSFVSLCRGCELICLNNSYDSSEIIVDEVVAQISLLLYGDTEIMVGCLFEKFFGVIVACFFVLEFLGVTAFFFWLYRALFRAIGWSSRRWSIIRQMTLAESS